MKRLRVWGLLLPLALAGGCPVDAPPVTSPSDGGTDAGPDTWEMPKRPVCEGVYAELPTPTEPLSERLLTEVSGIVASPSQPNVLWMHNDSGDAARLYAANTEGKALARVVLDGITLTDAEDIAAAPCPDGSGPCLWVADVGNNRSNRSEVYIYAVPEPRVDPNSDTLRALLVPAEDIWRFPLRYPADSPFDSEALVVLPDASALLLIEKRHATQSRVVGLRAPFARDEVNRLELLGLFSNPGVDISNGRMITAADLHPSGRRMLIRTYTGVYEVLFDEGETALDLPGQTARTITLGPLSEPQGEATTYDHTGKGIWTVSEDPQQQAPKPLNHYACFE